MKIQYVTNSEEFSGVGNRASQIRRRLGDGLELVDWKIDGVKGELKREAEVVKKLRPWPGMLGSKSINWVRLGRGIGIQGSGESEIFHLTNQTLSFLAGRLSPSVVTVHDIIEVTDPQDRKASLWNRYLYSGIGRAERVIAVSEYVKQQVMEYYAVAEKKITVIYNGVDQEVFYPLENVRRDLRKILYVGSEHPRKNLRAVLEVVAALKKKWPEVRLVKVGAAGLSAGRRETERVVNELGLQEAVEWREGVSGVELNQLYNEVGVLLFPSRQEGFGLPVLEAMAAGCPVVCSNTTSLPEVVGAAALMHDPDDIEGMVLSVERLMEDRQLREKMRQEGFIQAGKFSWDTAASQVHEVYMSLI